MVARGGHGLTDSPDVLVVGAGPAGLTAALQAHDHGARVAIVERRAEAFRPSRAMILHPRTLELLRPLGVTPDLLDRADRAPRAELHLGSTRIPVPLGEVALRDAAFPHLTLLRQTDAETVLAHALERRGVTIERGVELMHVAAHGDAARATMRTPSGQATLDCRFVVGCDGPDSTVRACAGIGWHGADYRDEVVLADAELDGDLTPGSLHVVAGRRGLIFVFALGENATWRILATRLGPDGRAAFGQPGRAVPLPDIQDLLTNAGLPARVTELQWSARVRLQHRFADSYRVGPLFIAGDAAHAHSPAAAQGMNTGIGDAVNLGWKLAFACGGGTYDALLDSYERERRPVARQVLALTHLVFFAEASTHPFASILRGTVVPAVAPALPALLRQPSVLPLVTRLLSQSWVRYRRSPLAVEGAPHGRGQRPGDRLPDESVIVDGVATRLHEVTAHPGLHVLLERDAPASVVPDSAHTTVHRISSWPGRGLRVVRPDGHIGYRCGESDPAQLSAWLRLVGASSSTGHGSTSTIGSLRPCREA